MLNHKQLRVVLWLFGIFLFSGYMFPNHYHPYREYVQDGLESLAILMALGCLACLPKPILSIPSLVILPISLCIVIVLQTINGMVLYPMDSFFPVIYLLALLLAMTLGATISAHDQGLEKLCRTLAFTFLAVGLLSVLFQNIQLSGFNIPNVVMYIYDREKIRPYANIAQPNLLALVFCFSLASVWWLYQARRLHPWSSVVVVLLLFWGLALTQSRIAWLILPIFAVFFARRYDEDRRVSKLLLLLLLLIYVGLVISTPTLLSWAGIPVSSIGDRAGQTAVRLVLWQQAWLISTLHPWFGAGWFQFGHYQAILATLFNPSEYSEFAHNTVLNLAAEIGWPLTMAICGGLAFWFYHCCLARWADRQVRFISLMLVAICMHSMVEFPIWYGFILFPTGVMLGALQVKRLGIRYIEVSRYWIVVVWSVAVLFIGLASWDYYRVMLGFNALHWQQAGKTSGTGSTEKPEWTLYPQFYDYFSVVKVKIYPGMPKRDIQFLEQAALRFSFPPILHRLALAYAYNQRQDEALQVLISIKYLHGVEYEKTYGLWADNAEKDPHYFKVIFQHMPKPEKKM